MIFPEAGETSVEVRLAEASVALEAEALAEAVPEVHGDIFLLKRKDG